MVVYSDCDCQYVGMDVFDSFEAALAQYNQRLRETRADHPDDPDWVMFCIGNYGIPTFD